MRVCHPTTYGGSYDVSKTTYDSATLATFNILIEISNNKHPPSSHYGSDVNMLNPPFDYDGNVNNGYATKHIRTALMAIDAVEPYVQIHRVNKRQFYNDYQPLRQLEQDRWCKKTNGRKVRKRKHQKLTMGWKVGGSFLVDETFLLYGRWSDFPWAMNCIDQMDHDVFMPLLESATFVGSPAHSSSNSTTSALLMKTPIQKNGSTRWSDPNINPNPSFSTRKVDLSIFDVGDLVAIFAVAKVDQNWKGVGGRGNGKANVWPDSLSGRQQSHMVNSRTNPNYYKEKLGSGREVQGRLYWISVPITVKIR